MSTVLGGVELYLIHLYQCSVILSVTSSFTACSSKYCSFIYSEVTWGQLSRVLGWIEHLKISPLVWNAMVYQENTSVSQESSGSEQEMEVKSPSFQPFTSQSQLVPPMSMPYIEGPKMNWTVTDGLYHMFLKWKLKCENILDCELVMLPESKKCKKVIDWSSDFGMDQYVSWCLPVEDLCLDTIWSKIWRFLQATSKWSQSQIWAAYKL